MISILWLINNTHEQCGLISSLERNVTIDLPYTSCSKEAINFTPMLHKNDNEMACNIDGMELIDHLLYVLSISPTVKSKSWNNFIIIFPLRESPCLPQSRCKQGFAIQKYSVTSYAWALSKLQLLQHWGKI